MFLLVLDLGFLEQCWPVNSLPCGGVQQALEEPSSNTYRWGKFTKRMITEVTNTVDHIISNVFAKLLQIYNIRKEE